VTHIHSFFGGQLKAEFPMAAPLLQKAFLGGNPGDIRSSSLALWTSGCAAITRSPRTHNCSRPAHDADETGEILEVIEQHLAPSTRFEIAPESLRGRRSGAALLERQPLPHQRRAHADRPRRSSA